MFSNMVIGYDLQYDIPSYNRNTYTTITVL